MRNEEIISVLKQLEAEYSIEILYACETGSRAWGFPSPDSDFDVRFIYKHKLDWYLSLATKDDFINKNINYDLDIVGWDLRKSLEMLKKSNASLIERFQSPIVYCSNEDFAKAIHELKHEYYSPIAVFYHHYSLAKNFKDEVLCKKEFKLKSYLYLVRSLLSCNYVIHSNAVIPMTIKGLMEFVKEDNKNMLDDLIALKSTKNEDYYHISTNELIHFVTDLFEFVTKNKNGLSATKTTYEKLDHLFIKTIKQ